jgi:outer membrane protein OmpA-like peptidoglycan-associated protein
MTIKHSLFITVLFISFNSFGQKKQIDAQKSDSEKNYIDLAAILKKMGKTNKTSDYLCKKNGDFYYFSDDFTNAIPYYETLFALSQNQPAEYYYRYARSLKSIGNNAKYDEISNLFMLKFGRDVKSGRDFQDEIEKNSGRYEVKKLNVNSFFSDFSSSFLDNKLIFTSYLDNSKKATKNSEPSSREYSRLYSAIMKPDGNLEAADLFKGTKDTKYNEASPVFTKDGQTMYYTKNESSSYYKDSEGNKIYTLKIFKAKLHKGVWSKGKELPFSSTTYSVANPALSKDDKTLYFASDMKGGMGNTDLYYVNILDDETYSTPKNLGLGINTKNKESYPFVSNDGDLYFSSDGHPGLGGLDVFVVKILENNTFGPVLNPGAPINGSYDDFAYLINSNKQGYFSSNRPGGMGAEDIYGFTETRSLNLSYTVWQTLMDNISKEPVQNAKISLFDNNHKLLQEEVTDKDGKYSFELLLGDSYLIKLDADNYFKEEFMVDAYNGDTNAIPNKVTLIKSKQQLKTGDDVGQNLSLEPIYFDLDKWQITKNASFELSKVIELMKGYPNIRISINAYTDSRKSDAYNLELSKKRANAVAKWIVSHGIAKKRIKSTGYGETVLINKCADGIECTEEEHSANRRCEFIITNL